MPRFFQVNQCYANYHEFYNDYLCAPNDLRCAHWIILKELNIGDYIFHYYSRKKEIFGISFVAQLGAHKGETENVVQPTNRVCLEYSGPHLSLDQMTGKMYQREKNRNPQRYLEVHVRRQTLLPINLGPNFFPNTQMYCKEISLQMIIARWHQFPILATYVGKDDILSKPSL